MTRSAPIAAACCVFAAAVSITASSAADESGTRSDWFDPYQVEYLNAYEDCWEALGADCGRNIVDDGLAPDGREPEEWQVRNATARLQTALNPPEPAPVETAPVETAEEPTDYGTTTEYAAPAPVSSGGCPASMAGEASSPDAVNPSSGASGCYQVIPSTQAAMGEACADVNAPSCLAAICASQGNSAWAASGSTPC